MTARALAVVVVLAACGDDALPIAELQDPATCMECHSEHYREWSGSMHAYASEDPVFVAMNRRGQRETGGRLGDFCFKCHAPMAIELDLLGDPASFDPAALPPAAKGITCYFCHNVKQVTSTHNNGLVLAFDQTMRGGVKDAVDTPAHRSKYDRLMDGDENKSELCGSCHDIVMPTEITGLPEPLELERTFQEWKATIFADDTNPGGAQSCGSCHMRSRSLDVIADKPGLDVPAREDGYHDHQFPGIDKALTPFPQQAEQAVAVQRLLDQSINIIGPLPRTGPPPGGGICVEPGGTLRVRVDSIGTGHSWPSGAAQDRRAWLEVIAYDATGGIVFSRGVVPEGVDPAPLDDQDPNLYLWDRTYKTDNTPSHFFWDAARVDSNLLLGPTTFDQNSPAFDHSRSAIFMNVDTAAIDRVTARMRFRPLPFTLLDDLIATGDLAPAIRDLNRTLEVGQTRTWLKATRDPTTFCGPP